MRRAVAAVAAAAIASTAAASCYRPPRPGDACTDPAPACFDAQTALACLGGVRVGVHCGGPGGCLVSPSTVWCDQSTANENDVCMALGRQFGVSACTSDRRAQLVCERGRFVKRADCHGPLGCGHVGNDITCDATVGEPGDVCEAQDRACTADGLRELRCRDGRLALLAACEGDEHCKARDRGIDCDERRGTPGAPCTASAACSADGKALLACNGDVWSVHVPCRGPDGCTIQDRIIGCDTSLAVAGEGCDGKGASCAGDGKTMLDCANGTWTVARVCPKACEPRRAEHVVSCK